MRKKLFAVLVALCMVLSLLPATAFAEDVDDDAADDDVTVEDTADDTAADDEDEDEPEDAGDDAAEAEEEAEATDEDVQDNEFFEEEEDEFFFEEEEEILEEEEEALGRRKVKAPEAGEKDGDNDDDGDGTEAEEVEIVVSTFMFDAPMFLMAVEDIPVTVDETGDVNSDDIITTVSGDENTEVAEITEDGEAAAAAETNVTDGVGTVDEDTEPGTTWVGAPLHNDSDSENTDPDAWYSNAFEGEDSRYGVEFGS